ncbi:unknown [Haloarcula marismortui ATCC 43049]|uniref:Uncharacterized protein n=1 Tax=Haloarcula marismortui (strain ATCC 43049 / DSM 3752 / JCM 8966 / VKM B-1809) TaxID=272569 RepID=Q5UX11_HALMA|nr:hypothetical protein [Haloarcula marismortui]AAV48192.1 unknown [Haloarcula marismortui ATCC 43049]QCP92850.1 hypothetical protein E6P14_19025 [Haloarcula marismortui ATCC 43049]
MERARAVITSVIAIILGVTLLSGPLVPSVTLASEPESVALESGNVTVSTVEMPEEVTIEKGSYGAASYYLDAPPVRIHFANLTGRPTLVYKLTIEELGYTRTTNHFLDDSAGDTYALTLASDTFTDEEIEREQYNGTVTVSKRDEAGHGVVATRNITISVVE